MGVKEYYEKYWQDKLPSDIKFFGGHPKPGDADQNFRVIAKWVKPGVDVLDYGCGEGYLVAKLKANGYGAIGVDISETALKLASEKFPSCLFAGVGSHTSYYGGIGKVDAIVSFDVLEHIFDFDEIFDFLDKHLKKGGTLIITTNEIGFCKLVIIATFFLDTFFHPYSPHIRFFTRNSLQRLLEKKGYEVIHYERRRNYFGIISEAQTVVAKKLYGIYFS